MAVATAARKVGITHFKITGGEPLVRHDILDIVRRLKALEPTDLSMTTNGLMLPKLAEPLKAAGLDRLTISLDSFRNHTFQQIASRHQTYSLEDVLTGIQAAENAGFHHIKVNTVIIGGINDEQVHEIAAITLLKDWTVRFIEYMPLGNAALVEDDSVNTQTHVVSNEIIKTRIESHFGPLLATDRTAEVGVGPAIIYQIPGAAGRLGFISAMSQPFCENCNRLRLTAKGELRACLFDGGEIDLLPILEKSNNTDAIIEQMAQCIREKPLQHSSRGNRAMNQLGG